VAAGGLCQQSPQSSMSNNSNILQEAHSWLHSGNEPAAIAVLAKILHKSPMDFGANKLRAIIHGEHDEFGPAALCLQRAIAANSKDMEARFMLGNVLIALKKYEGAIQALKPYVAAYPTDISSRSALAQCFISLGRLADARAVMEEGIAVAPDDANSYGFYATLLATIGYVSEGMDIVKQGYARLPTATGLLAFIVQNSNFISFVDPVEHKRQHRQYMEEITPPQAPPKPQWNLTFDAGGKKPPVRERLRVGFLSGDFREHACAIFLRCLFTAAADGTQEPIDRYCYYTHTINDATTAFFRSASTFRIVASMDDSSLAAAVRGDDLDVLIDCSGHFDGNRLTALNPRLAPVQCTYLGYPNTTGLVTMDYRIVDAITDPPENNDHLTELPARLPDCFVCFSPNRRAPQVRERPPTAPIVFGSFNRLEKITEQTLKAWCDVLTAVPGSKMMIKSRMMSEELRSLAVGRFVALGIARERIILSDFVPLASDHLELYNQIDIAMDAFPYNGTTTTCEAMWMGVPVITLRGDAHRGRVGSSLNAAVGLQELTTYSIQDYIAAAVALANDRGRLAGLRATLRQRMASSPLCDGPRFAKAFFAMLTQLRRST